MNILLSSTAKLSTISDRRLEKILEERKDVGKTAPLAQPEEDTDSLDSRTTIDSGVQANTHETGDNPDPKLGKSIEERSENPRTIVLETFVVIFEHPDEKSKRNKVVDSVSDAKEKVVDSGSVAEEVSKDTEVSTTGQDTQSIEKHNNTKVG